MMRFLLLVSIVGCAATPAPLTAQHPANPHAAAGRVAPAPPSLRSGVIEYPDVPPVQASPPAQHHHHP